MGNPHKWLDPPEIWGEHYGGGVNEQFMLVWHSTLIFLYFCTFFLLSVE